MKRRNCFIGQSGGPTVAINASLAGIITKCHESNEYDHIYGMINGIKGLLEDNYFDLVDMFKTQYDIDLLMQSPAMYLGSCRYKLPDYQNDPQTYMTLFSIFDKLNITDFFYIGGNDSMDTVAKLSNYAKIMNSDISFIGIPKTIDNDLKGTDHTPGFGSAAKYVATSMLEIAYDSSIYKLNSITIVEIMGRNAGWLTAASALARSAHSDAPDLIYLPEVPFIKENFYRDIEEVFKTKKNIIIAVSEGIKDEDGEYIDSKSKYAKRDVFGNILHSGTGKALETMAYERFKCKVRSVELNVLQRSAGHLASKVDLDEAYMIGQYAVETAMNGESAKMIIVKRISDDPYQIECLTMDVNAIANQEKCIPIEWINEKHNYINDKLYDYLYPLIQGEVNVAYKNGIPNYISIQHLK
ncbi:MAG: 6-phosphofructokinase [Erysipelotrichaceae bacterium]|nr:6-phosphofructokinase [Erysipelotrichaceae bacterium]